LESDHVSGEKRKERAMKRYLYGFRVLAASAVLLLGAAAAPAAQYVKTGKIGYVGSSASLIYIRLQGDPILCTTGGSGKGPRTAVLERGFALGGGAPASEDDLNRSLATAQVAAAGNLDVELIVEDNTGTSYGCRFRSLRVYW
jgi:hypothetical protein